MEEHWIDYMTCPLFRSLVDHNWHELPYIEGSSRYTSQHHAALLYLYDTGRIHESLATHTNIEDAHLSMCLTDPRQPSTTRTRVNREQHAKWIANAPANTTFAIGDQLYAIGMPIVACANLAQYDVVNSHKYIVLSATDSKVTLKRGDKLYELSHKLFTNQKHFRLGFCDSVFRNQGYTLTTPHNIYDAKSMSLQDIDTALGRFKRQEDIGINAETTCFTGSSHPKYFRRMS